MYSFLDPLQRALSCVTLAVLDVRGGLYPAPVPHTLRLGDGTPTPLQDSSGRVAQVFLSVEMLYHIVRMPAQGGSWEIETAAYMFALSNRAGHEIVAYHWHPDGESVVTMPHLHLGHGARVGHRELGESHLPTGPIVLQDVLRLTIEGLRVRARRDDWRDVLVRTSAPSTH